MSRINEIAGTAFTNWLSVCFYLLFHSIYEIKLKGLGNYSASPSTIITINHKRDLDVPIVASILHLRKTVFNNKLRMHFVAKDDLFYPGFLTAHFPIFGAWGRIIHLINLTPVMKALQAYPMSHLVRNKIGFLMREIAQIDGNICLKQVIKPSGLNMLASILSRQNDGDLGDITVSDFLGYPFSKSHHQPADINILQNGLSRTIRSKTLKAIKQQLSVFTQILDEGGICMLAPEGQLSDDGRFWPVKSGLNRLISMTTGNIRVLPVNTTYDFMTQGRMWIYVTIGPEIANLKEQNKTELERQVQENIVKLGPVTLGQVGSEVILGMLKNGREAFNELELLDIISTRVEELDASGVCLDERMLQEKSLKKRIRDFLRYCMNRRIVKRDRNGSQYLITTTIKNNDFSNFHDNPLQYSANELNYLLELHEKQSLMGR